MSIKSALDVDYQLYALSALRSGIESYDRRHGWRGPILNTKIKKNWRKILKEKKIDPSLNWVFAKIINIKDVKLRTFITQDDSRDDLVAHVKMGNKENYS